VAEQPGIEAMRRRIERASRHAPPSRHPASAAAEVSLAPEPGAAPDAPASAPPMATPAAPARRRSPRAPAPATAPAARERLEPGAPPVNLAIRVRRPLDDRLAEVIHGLRRQGVRTSKVELIEMLLWEMPADADAALLERLRLFRDWAPRGPR
jgi:hypothetical protein